MPVGRADEPEPGGEWGVSVSLRRLRNGPGEHGAGLGGGPCRHGPCGRSAGLLSDERGVATVLVVGMIAVLMVLVAVGVQIGAAVVTRHRVAAAADLAALAAAGQLVVGGDRACERAGRIAQRMSATMTACRISEWEAYVEVTARPPGWAALAGTASAHARAGPAEVPDGH